MPLLPSLSGLKDLTSNMNPLNLFSSPEVSPASTTSMQATAEAGPGPSSQANTRRPNLSPTSLDGTNPLRPSLKNPSISSSDSDSQGRRKSSGNSVVIVDPGVDGEGLDASEARRRAKAKRENLGLNVETRRKKKALDTYCIVKPPPTSSKNALNLQIQLVVKPPRGRDRSASNTVSVRSTSVSTTANVSTPTTSTTLNPEQSDSDRARSESPAPISSADEAAPGAKLARSSSRKSSVSTRSSTGSVATTVSSTGKRIEPMFNLTVHNVMQPTVVTDAATDAKVAKFHKRNIDIAGVGILEPAEVWRPMPNQHLYPTFTNSDDGHGPWPRGGRPASMLSTAPLSPTVTRHEEEQRPSLDLKMRPSELLNASENGAKKFFGKIFKKRGSEDISRLSQQVAAKQNSSPTSSGVSLNANGVGGSSALAPVDRNSGMPLRSPSLAAGQFAEYSQHIGNPTFGTSPIVITRRSSGTIVSPDGAITGLISDISLGGSPSTDNVNTMSIAPSSRPIGYSWTVRRWAKKNTEGWAAHLVAAAAAGLDMVNGVGNEGDNEVVFEWVKMRSSGGATTSNIRSRRFSTTGTVTSTNSYIRPRSLLTADRVPSPSPNPNQSKTSLNLQPPGPIRRVSGSSLSQPPSPIMNPIDTRPEPVRRVSASFSPPSKSVVSNSRLNVQTPPLGPRDPETSSLTHTIDDGEESDPEDSETPWSCSIWVKKTGHRQLLGTMTPAPHHPKVIGVLKIPTKLEAVSLAVTNSPTSTNNRNSPSPLNMESTRKIEMAKRVCQEVALTEENLKDVVCVTGMWVAAREEFGGIGRNKKK